MFIKKINFSSNSINKSRFDFNNKKHRKMKTQTKQTNFKIEVFNSFEDYETISTEYVDTFLEVMQLHEKCQETNKNYEMCYFNKDANEYQRLTSYINDYYEDFQDTFNFIKDFRKFLASKKSVDLVFDRITKK